MHKIPVRTKKIVLDGDYTGFECTVKTSVPMSVFSLIQTGQWNLIQKALRMMLVEWNFTDENGEPLPQPGETVQLKDEAGELITTTETDDKGRTKQVPVEALATSLVPVELGMLIIGKVSEAIMDVPPS